MKSKLILLMAFAGASPFAETHFSIHFGGYGPGYYAPPPVYYEPPPVYSAPARPWVYCRYGPCWDSPGFWGEDPERQHERAEWYGLRNHQERERYIYGDSPELQEHQGQERWELRHEQWHERNGDYEAGHGPAHGSARDGWYH